MAAHITYLSEEGLTEKFGRRLQDRDEKSFGFEADFITRAMDYFDLAEEFSQGSGNAKLADAFAGHAMGEGARFCLVSFDTDWLYPTAESRHIVHALNAVGAPVSFVELSAPYGHDSFLLEVPALDRVIEGFLK